MRTTLGLVLGIMVVMAALALVFALSTVRDRRQRDPKPLPTPHDQRPATGAPSS
jgi:hypothetical protein